MAATFCTVGERCSIVVWLLLVNASFHVTGDHGGGGGSDGGGTTTAAATALLLVQDTTPLLLNVPRSWRGLHGNFVAIPPHLTTTTDSSNSISDNASYVLMCQRPRGLQPLEHHYHHHHHHRQCHQ
ncbi:hypothetical protein HZH68_012892 [Vespula germanica]|uniref:Secreted protein n=1 Tax=Vespula germanica TaxID=30212 RepID=A0A834MWL7_VESGE|nr:hypothetical protein HZH68_012892 [Vespula germanica]